MIFNSPQTRSNSVQGGEVGVTTKKKEVHRPDFSSPADTPNKIRGKK